MGKTACALALLLGNFFASGRAIGTFHWKQFKGEFYEPNDPSWTVVDGALPLSTGDLDRCKQHCAQDVKCKGITFQEGLKHCWLSFSDVGDSGVPKAGSMSYRLTRSNATCALHAAEVVDELLDSAAYIMASIARCEAGNQILCEVDVASAIEAVAGMINVILKTVESCAEFEDPQHQCGMSASALSQSVTGLVAAVSGLAAKCPHAMQALDSVGIKLNGNHTLDSGTEMSSTAKYGGSLPGFGPGFGQCVINIKDVIRSLFYAIKRIMELQKDCEDPFSEHCVHNSIKIVSAFTGLGEYLAGAIGKCAANEKMRAEAACGQMSLRMFHQLSNVGAASTAMVSMCYVPSGELLKIKSPAAERLYLENSSEESVSGAGSSTSLILASFLPITAVLSFVLGKRYAKPRSQEAHAHEILVAVELE